MYHHTEAERLLEIAALPADVPLSPELRAIGHALLAVADAIRAAAEDDEDDDDPVPFRPTLAGYAATMPTGGA